MKNIARICSPIILSLCLGTCWLPMLHLQLLGGAIEVVAGASAPSNFGPQTSNEYYNNDGRRRRRRRSSREAAPTPFGLREEHANQKSPSPAPLSTTTAVPEETQTQTIPCDGDEEDSVASVSADTARSTMGSPESLHLKPRVVSLNIMVAGLAGLGKTTMCRALLDAWWKEIQEEEDANNSKGSENDGKKKGGSNGPLGFLTTPFSSSSMSATTSTMASTPAPPRPPTVSTTAISPSAPFEYYDEKANTILRVRIIDTPGFGNRVNHRNSVKPITDYISDCRRKRFRREQSPSSDFSGRRDKKTSSSSVLEASDVVDDDSNNRLLVHVCLYFLSPGRFLAIDRHFLKHVQDEVTIVPVIAKADTMTDDEVARYRAELSRIWQEESIDVYSLDADNTSGSGFRIRSSSSSSSGSVDKYYRGRKPGEVLAIISRDGIYPWGHSCSLDPGHSDLKLIRDSLLSEHTERFLELATSKYKAYRDQKITRQQRSDAVKYAALVGLAAIQLGRVSVGGTTLREIVARSVSFLAPVLETLRGSPGFLFRRTNKSPLEEEESGADDGNEVHGDNGIPEPTDASNKKLFFGLFGMPSFDSVSKD